ncbi:hypothetical protein PV11_02387 [Exophiala sideris]|uniref:F-box domain-containing protein n=1 Tax=Exophiala sideris TaxID=1016849 RepID=A0A0D1YZ17_9EURO|nr:hypothetical protein PV11_02387 [Exophiala sideris]
MDESSSIPWRCPMLELPAEIRVAIYRHLFANAQLFLQGRSKFFHCGPKLCSCDFPWQILGTCWRLRHEAMPYLLLATTIRFASTLENADRLPQSYLSAIPQAVCRIDAVGKLPLRLDMFRGLKVLELRDLVIWCKYYNPAYLENPAADEGMIDRAVFNLKRSGVNLSELDGQRSFKVLLHCQFVTSSSKKSIHAIIDLSGKAVLTKSTVPVIRDRHTWAGFY